MFLYTVRYNIFWKSKIFAFYTINGTEISLKPLIGFIHHDVIYYMFLMKRVVGLCILYEYIKLSDSMCRHVEIYSSLMNKWIRVMNKL